MASKRDLKKTMYHIATELITEVYQKSIFSENDIESQADELIAKILEFANEYVNRVGKNGGKENRKEVKDYYKTLYADWDKGVEELIAEIEKLA